MQLTLNAEQAFLLQARLDRDRYANPDAILTAALHSLICGDHRAFLQIPLIVRRHILAAQAQQLAFHYENNREDYDLETGELIDKVCIS
ncbi:MAG: hypothetical protein HC838_07960 [Spirulinaceae cyanobacterium RM2_2_10]|nr:hypothetical protein [Spirulinaceae cyanobacterium SM2_1_0]NJO19996.1 hypothetical protein [Spirulinaceae cyanobacterium RM2_2_10]